MKTTLPNLAALVLPHKETAEVDRRQADFCKELDAYSPIGQTLARIAAVMSVRAERYANFENAVLIERSRVALAEFNPPPGLSPADLKRLRTEAECGAMFDPSAEAKEARRCEDAAIRTFLRTLKELQRMKKQADAAQSKRDEELLASFSPGDLTDEEFDAKYAELFDQAPRQAPAPPASARPGPARGVSEVPFAIGKRP